MAYTIEFIARMKDDVSGKLRGIGDAAKSSIGSLKDSFSSLGKVASGDLNGISDAMTGVLGILGPVGAGLGAVASAAVGSAISLQQNALAFDVLSQKTGASVEFLSGFTQAADDVRVSAETVNTSLIKFSKNLYDTKGAGADVASELMMLSDQFKNMADGPEKTALAMEKFGKSGADMIPILNQGGEAIRSMMADAQQMGLVIDSSMVESSKNMAAAVDNLGDSFEGLKNKIGAIALPVLTDAVNGASSAIGTLEAQMTIFDGWVKMKTGAEMTAQELVRLKTAIDTYNGSMRGSSSMTDGMVDAMMGVRGGATVMGSAMVAASEDAKRAAANTQVAMAMLASAQGAMMVQSAAAIKGSQGIIDNAYAAQYKSFKANQDKMILSTDIVASNFAAKQRGMIAAQKEQQAVAAQAAITDRDSNLARAESNTELTTSIDAINIALDKEMGLMGGGGGAARAMKDEVASLNEEMQKLEERQKTIGGYLGNNTAAMDAQQKVQTAYALATGQMTQEQWAQSEAVKALMQGLADKKVNEEQAVTSALALAQGYMTANDAIAVAGDSGKRFAEETANVNAIAAAAKTKVMELGLAIKEVPNEKSVDVVATVLGMSDLREAKTIVEKLDQHERHTITYNVVYKVTQSGAPPPGAPPPGTDPSNFNGGGGGGGGGRGGHDTSGASGASVYAGMAVKVGELGPEVFVPSQNGVIVPNHKTGNGDNITINVYTSDPEAAARAVMQKIKQRG